MTAKKKKRKPNKTSSRAAIGSSQSVADKQSTCFIIMPFGDWFDRYYENIYIPAIESVGLTPRRADDLYRPSAIVNDIWSLTKSAKVILADLSGKNPNVFYELGLAHAVAKPAILVAESIDDIPFDLRALRVIIYNKNEHDWGDILRGKIETAIKEVLASPLDSVLPTFLKVKEATSPKTVTQAEKDLISLKQDMDLIKLALQLEERPASRSRSSSYPLNRTEAMKLAREYRERGTNDEYLISKLYQAGWSVQAARNLIARMDQSYMKEGVKVRSQHNSGDDESD